MSEIQRYVYMDIEGPSKCDEGIWCLYTDHAAALRERDLRIAALEAENARLSAPVTDAEMRAHSVKIHNEEGQYAWLLDRGMVDALIAARKGAA